MLGKRDTALIITWTILGIAVALISYSYRLGTLKSPGPGMMPFILGVILTLCSVPLLIKSIRSIGKKAKQSDSSPWSGVKYWKILVIICSLIGYGVLLEEIGFVVVTIFFLSILFKTIDSQRWFSILITSFVITVITYLLFVGVLKVNLPLGILWRLGRIF